MTAQLMKGSARLNQLHMTGHPEGIIEPHPVLYMIKADSPSYFSSTTPCFKLCGC